MNGPQHYLQAERLLDLAAESKETTFEGDNPEADRLIAAAQVHATLAQVAAYAASQPTCGDDNAGFDSLDEAAWYNALVFTAAEGGAADAR